MVLSVYHAKCLWIQGEISKYHWANEWRRNARPGLWWQHPIETRISKGTIGGMSAFLDTQICNPIHSRFQRDQTLKQGCQNRAGALGPWPHHFYKWEGYAFPLFTSHKGEWWGVGGKEAWAGGRVLRGSGSEGAAPRGRGGTGTGP